MLTGCCSVKKINLTVDNAFILCTTNGSCVAECYRGFIFSSGKTKQSYSCLNGVWSPVLSTCKRKIFPERQLISFSYQRSRDKNDLLHVSYRTILTNNNKKLQFNKRTYFSKVCVCKLSNAEYIVNVSIQKSEYTVFLLGIPVIYVTYSVMWKINNVVPSNCSNVSKRLLSTAEMLEKRLSFLCSEMKINSTVNFTYSMNGSLVFIITFVVFSYYVCSES